MLYYRCKQHFNSTHFTCKYPYVLPLQIFLEKSFNFFKKCLNHVNFYLPSLFHNLNIMSKPVTITSIPVLKAHGAVIAQIRLLLRVCQQVLPQDITALELAVAHVAHKGAIVRVDQHVLAILPLGRGAVGAVSFGAVVHFFVDDGHCLFWGLGFRFLDAQDYGSVGGAFIVIGLWLVLLDT